MCITPPELISRDILIAMQARAKKAYTLFGVLFLLLGGLTLLNVIAALQVGQVFLWQAFAYGLMNLLVSYAFFKHESWLMYAFSLNLVANGLLLGASIMTYGADPQSLFLSLFGLAVMGSVLGFVYYTKKSLQKTAWSAYTGGLFILLWASTFVPNALSAF